MNEIYHNIGMSVVWVSAALGVMAVLGFIFVQILNLIGKHSTTIWQIVEYFFYRKDFKEWVKDKERLKKALPQEKKQ